MQVKSYAAPTITSAIRDIRRELGEDAVILSKKVLNGGVEVIAAIERKPPSSTHALPKAASLADRGLSRISRRLAFHGLDTEMIAKLVDGADGSESEESCLTAGLGKIFRFAPLTGWIGRPLVFIGPVGAGKTAVLAKLASRLILANEAVSTITCDTVRAGAVAQIMSLVGQLGRPVWTAPTTTRLRELMRDIPLATPVLIDTTGSNPFASDDMRALKDIIAVTGAEPLLVLPADTDYENALDYANAFSVLSPSRLIMTRIDLARRMGSLLRVADTLGLALAEASATPYIGEGLFPLSPRILSALFMRR